MGIPGAALTRNDSLGLCKHQSKPAAFAVLAFEQDPATEKFGQAFAQLKAKPGAFNTLRTVNIYSGKLLKESILIVAPDAYSGVDYGYLRPPAAVVIFLVNFQPDRASVSEFDCVAS